MHNIEHLNQQIKELEDQKSRILRSFGIRYSRRIKGVPYNPEKFKNKQEWNNYSELAKKKAFNRIRAVKQELKDLDSKIYQIHREISKIEIVEPFTSSKQFNEAFKQIIVNFK